MDLVIKGAQVVTENGIFTGGVAVKDGKIVAIGRDESLPSGKTEIDAAGQYLLPGGVDPHVHIRYPGGAHRETFITGSMAAAAGGVTTIIEHPISSPPQYSTETLMKRVEAVQEQAVVDVAFLGAAGGNRLEFIQEIGGAGIVGYKSFLHAAPEGRAKEFDGLTMESNYELYRGFEEIKKTGLPMTAHAEDNDLIVGFTKEFRARGATSGIDHAKARPTLSEVMSVERLIRLAKETGVPLYLVHISTPEAVAVAKAARDEGLNLHIETCPHYLYLTEESLVKYGAYAKCNPPLRTYEQTQKMWEYVMDGTIDTVGSDHAPYTVEEKEKNKEDIFVAPAGFPGIETRLPLILTAVKDGKISLERAVDLISTKPSKIFGLYPRKGAITVGADADLVLVNLTDEYELQHADMVTQAKDVGVVYDGQKVYGKVRKTFVRGEVVYDEGKITVNPGYGQWVKLEQGK